MDSQPTSVAMPAAPSWLGGAAGVGFLVTRIGSSDAKVAAADAAKLLLAAKDPWLKYSKEKNAYEDVVAVEIPDADNCALVSLTPARHETDVSRLGTWIMEQLSSGADWTKAEGVRPTHVSRMIPVEGTCDELDLISLAANVVPKHLETIRREGLRSATYEVIYEEHKPSLHLLPSVVNAAIGECLPDGYVVDLKSPSHSVLCLVQGNTCFLSVVHNYRDIAKHFAVHKALSAAAA